MLVTELDELAEEVAEERPAVGCYPDKSPHNNAMADVLVSQHDVTPSARDTRLVRAADMSASRHA